MDNRATDTPSTALPAMAVSTHPAPASGSSAVAGSRAAVRHATHNRLSPTPTTPLKTGHQGSVRATGPVAAVPTAATGGCAGTR